MLTKYEISDNKMSIVHISADKCRLTNACWPNVCWLMSVDQISVYIIFVDQISDNKMSTVHISVDQMSLNQLLIDQISDNKYCWLNVCQPNIFGPNICQQNV